MRKVYLTLENDRKVRLEIDLKVIRKFEMHAAKSWEEYAAGLLKGSYMHVDSTILAWLMAAAGEKADGRKLNLDQEQFGKEFTMPILTNFLILLQAFNKMLN